MEGKNLDYYIEADRYKRYLDGLTIQLAVKSIGGKYTKSYKKLKEKYDKSYKKWEKLCDIAYKKQKLESIGINNRPQKDLDLYKEIQKKAIKKRIAKKTRLSKKNLNKAQTENFCD
ncbi:hypothetical protein LCGC14_0638400 [marine sediment metagenome]|uniref:Uncharacterized protein n=1 Tax=marine sediment metagenome TaxID=412755 RepID=A0A0F9QZY1_9ZZZZ